MGHSGRVLQHLKEPLPSFKETNSCIITLGFFFLAWSLILKKDARRALLEPHAKVNPFGLC